MSTPGNTATAAPDEAGGNRLVRQLKYSAYLIRKNTLTTIGFSIVGVLIVLALLAPVIAPYPDQALGATDMSQALESPSLKHLFGTDEMGRDLFSRVLYGTRISLQIGILVVGLALAIGVPLGLIAGFVGGFIDEAIMRVTDIFLSFPPLLLAIAVAALLGRSLTNAMIAIAIAWWPWYTRLIRGTVVSMREKPFIEAARVIGTSPLYIMVKHLLPNSMSPVIVQASLDFGSVILTSAALSFLGLGAQPPEPEWGLILSTARNYFLVAPWYSFFPGMAMVVTVLAFNLVGDGLREITDPKTRRL
ncbi:MAG: ABC transporter permease [Bacillota bacterium]|nr:MAG: ABC transporter permease [Bacillota bacterium]